MGFFNSTSHFFVSLFTFLFSLIGSTLFIFGLYGRFSSQWDLAATEANGQMSILICLFLGLGMVVNAWLGSYGANRSNKFCLVIFLFISLACAIVAAWIAATLFGVSSDSSIPTGVGDAGTKLNDEISGHMTKDHMSWVMKHKEPCAIFMACVAGAEFLLFLSALVLCFERRQQYLPQYVVRK